MFTNVPSMPDMNNMMSMPMQGMAQMQGNGNGDGTMNDYLGIFGDQSVPTIHGHGVQGQHDFGIGVSGNNQGQGQGHGGLDFDFDDVSCFAPVQSNV